MPTFDLMFLAVAAGVFAFVGLHLSREVRRTRLREKVEGFNARLDLNDARLWQSVFPRDSVLCGDMAASEDPLDPEVLDRLCRQVQEALDRGTIGFGEKCRDLRVLSCDPQDGTRGEWNLRTFAIRDAAGHRFSLRADFLASDRGAASPRIREGEGTVATVHLDGIARASDDERRARARLAAMEGRDTIVPWDTGISR